MRSGTKLLKRGLSATGRNFAATVGRTFPPRKPLALALRKLRKQRGSKGAREQIKSNVN